ncbi:MAG: hypothetical protein IT493_10230 [Gammaproteobacteria bacterium]|nr:hypothetical protein [Gammaproteobacteria bacterium]
MSTDGGSYFGIQDLDAFAPRQNARGLSQEIAGLVVGTRYALTFESNERHTNPNFLAQWQVIFGGETQFSTLTNTAWVTDVMHFTATNTTQTLQFVATKNYAALFPWIDRTFGTHHLPATQYPRRYGIDMPMPTVLGAQLLLPLRPGRNSAGRVPG